MSVSRPTQFDKRGVLAKIEESGGETLASTLAYNEKLSNKISKFIEKHNSDGGVADEYRRFRVKLKIL